MSEMVQINLRAGEDQKARWEAYLEESGRFATLSELIRASVEAEIKREAQANAEPGPALSQDLERLQEELTAVRKNVAWLREHFQEDVDISGLAQRVFNELEPLPEIEEPIQTPDDVEHDAESYRQQLQAETVIEPQDASGRSPQTTTALADRLETTPARIEDAIEHLDAQFLPIVVVDVDGECHYFREV